MGGEASVMEQQAKTTIELPPPPAGAERWQICLYSHTHWDREWYQPFERFRLQLVGAIDRILDTLDADPQFSNYTLDGQTIVLADYLMIRPERRGQLERLIRGGRVEIGPWYILPDEFLVSGESMVRNLLEGRRICRQFDSLLPLGYLPDPFGHVAQMPQILRGFGIDVVMFSRGMGDEFERLGNEFIWRSPDGSSVLALVQTGAHFINGYCNSEMLSKIHDPEDERIYQIVEDVTKHLSKTAHTPVLVMAVGCDHETINPELPAIVEKMRRLLPGADVDVTGLATIGGEARRYADMLEANGSPLSSFTGELRGSRHAPILAGIFSARIPLKQDNVRVQTMLERYVEPITAIAERSGIGLNSSAFLNHAWRVALANQPHDSIGGCSVDSVHDEMPARSKRVLDLSEGLLQELATVLGCEDRDMVFNPHPFTAGGIVRGARGGARWVAPMRPHAICELATASEDDNGARIIGDSAIANSELTVTVSSSGTVDIALNNGTMQLHDALKFVDIADTGDEYDIGHLPSDTPIVAKLQSHKVAMNDGGVACMELRHTISIPRSLTEDRTSRSAELVDHTIVTLMRLAGDLSWVECETRFNNRSLDHRLRVQVGLGVIADRAFADGHFAVVERPISVTKPRVAWRQDPVPSQHCESMVVVEGEGAQGDPIGVGVLTRGLHEYEIVKTGETSAMELTLLRAVGWLSRDDIPGRQGHAGPGLATPGAQCIGPLQLEYAIAPFNGDWQSNRLPQRARRYVAPPLVLEKIFDVIRPESGQAARKRDLLASAGSVPDLATSLPAFVAAAPLLEGIELSALKVADDGSGDTIVRGFNPYRATHEARLTYGSGSVGLARLDETALAEVDDLRVGGGVASVLVQPGAICTFRISAE